MIKYIFILSVTLLFLNTSAQVYFPSSSDNPVWIENTWERNSETGIPEFTYFGYTLFGDTVINDTLYQKLYSFPDTIFSTEKLNYVNSLRTDISNKVFIRTGNGEELLYDFSKEEIYDTIKYVYDNNIGLPYAVIYDIDTFATNDMRNRKIFILLCAEFGNSEWFEGIGSCYGLLNLCVYSIENSQFMGSELMNFYMGDSLICNVRAKSTFPETPSFTADNKGFKIELYPNPTEDVLQIEGDFRLISYIEFYNLDGKLIRSIQNPKSIIDTSFLNSGVYIVRMRIDLHTVIVRKIIIL